MAEARVQDYEARETGRAGGMIERLSEKLGANAGAHAVYGDPVERDGVTVIPVAKVRWGFGGGEGHGPNEKGKGSGGGGGVMVSPIGYIELKGGTSEFKTIRDPLATLALVVAGSISGLMVLRGLKRLIRS
jgi:uncharacterized spore protein YtfJ